MLFFERSECKGTLIFTNLQINPKENFIINIRFDLSFDINQSAYGYTLFIYRVADIFFYLYQ